MKTPKPKIAYAAVDKEKPVIDAFDIFQDTDIKMGKSERLIKVIVMDYNEYLSLVKMSK